MFTKFILSAVLAACGVQSNSAASPDEPDKFEPDKDTPTDQHFCCHSVDHKTWSGEGCNTIGPNQIDACNQVLYCPGEWSKEDGKVFCD